MPEHSPFEDFQRPAPPLRERRPLPWALWVPRATLTLVARFDYGQAAALRLHVAAFIYHGLVAAGIDLEDAVDDRPEPVA